MSEQSEALELEQLIRNLNDPANQAAPDRIDNIQRQIQRIQRHSGAWQIGLDLLEHREALMRFYGALTLTIKVNADWEADQVAQDRNLIHQLIERLVTSYVKLSMLPDETYVISKLCTTLVAVFQKSDSAWAYPVRHVLACGCAGQYIPQEEVPDINTLLSGNSIIAKEQLRSMLMLVATLSDEAGALSNTSISHSAETRMSNNAQDVWQIIRFCIQSLTRSQLEGGFALGADARYGMSIALATIEIVPFWTNYVQTGRSSSETITECFKACMAAMMLFFEQGELSFPVLQALTALEQNHHRLLLQTMPGYAAAIIRSPTAMSWIGQMLGGDFDIEPSGYVEYLEALMNSADLTTSTYLGNEIYIQALSQIQQLLRCAGAAGVEDTACQTALEIITSVAEGLNDWEEPTSLDSGVRNLVRQACHDCLLKIEMPLSELSSQTQTWDSDERTRFQDFRFDVQDYLQNAFVIRGLDLIEEIVGRIVDEGHDIVWTRFEASLFGLVAFSDTMNSDPDKFDKYLGIVFSCDKWLLASRLPDGHDKVRKIMIKLVGETTSFLERHEGNLVSILNFLFDSLRITASVTSASRAIFTLCDAQRTMLVDALPQFITSLETVSDLESDARSRIFGGVSAIIQALPNETTKTQPLSRILSVLDNERNDLLAAGQPGTDLRNQATDLLWILATIGKGFRVPSDAPIEVEEGTPHDEEFWTAGPGEPVQQLILSLYDSLRQFVDGDSDSLFIEATCDFLKSAFTEAHPSPFKFTPAVNLEILQRLIRLENPQPDHVLGTASSYLASIKSETHAQDFSILFMSVVTQCQIGITTHHENHGSLNTDFCAAATEFFSRAMSKWVHIWLRIPEFEQSAQVITEMSLLLLKDSDTLPRRSGASFFAALFDASGSSKVTMNQANAAKMASLLQAYGPRVLASILGLLGGECARSELEALTEPLKKFIQKQPFMANKLIREAVKDHSQVLTPRALQATKPEQRDRFASQIIMLKGARKTNEIVREFWVACKGSSFGYVV